MKKRAVIVTGALGGIGAPMCEEFHDSGYVVIALDRADGEVRASHYLREDISQVVGDAAAREGLVGRINGILESEDAQLVGLINNAAVQILGNTETLSADAWHETLDTNLLAPFFLTQAFLKHLEEVGGSVVNVSSIHEKLTKADFLAYATSKAALSGMTRAMAVELGGRVRVNAISPAAIATPMLREGFKDNPEAYEQLGAAHPTQRIGKPEEVAKVARYLIEEAPLFLTGACLGLDGAISSRLHDPA